jgi:hypothetical protein
MNNQQSGGRCVSVFLLVEVQKYYKLRDPEERINTYLVVIFHERHDTDRFLASLWREYKKFKNRINEWYSMVNIRESYMYLMTLIFILYGEKDCSKFSEAWIPLAYTIAIFKSSVNWGAIISKQLSINIVHA